MELQHKDKKQNCGIRQMDG